MDSTFGTFDPLANQPAWTTKGLAVAPDSLTSDYVEEAVSPGSGASIGHWPSDTDRNLEALDDSLIALGDAYFLDTGRVMKAASGAGLRRFVRQVEMKVRPSVGVDPTGEVVATWRQGNEALSLQFTDLFRLKYALTTEGQGRLERRWGAGNHVLTFFEDEPRAVVFRRR